MAKRFFSGIVCLLIPFLIAACQPRIVYLPVEEGNEADNYSAESDAQDVSSDGEQTWFAVKAYCDHESIPADKTLILWYYWGTLEEAHGLEYFGLTDHTVFIDDIEVPILADGVEDPFFNESEGYYLTEYWMDIGYLEPGYHEIITIATPRQQVFDGWDWFGPGTEHECSEYLCSVTVEEGGDQEFAQEQDWEEENNGEEPPAEDEETVCNRSRYVRETIPDNTDFAPGEVFEKTWTVRNDGVCTWNSGYTLRHTQGSSLGGETSLNLPHEVAPGEEITLRLSLKAPQTPGTYTGRWEIFSDDGEALGWYSVVIDVVAQGDQPEAPQPQDIEATVWVDPLLYNCKDTLIIYGEGFAPDENISQTITFLDDPALYHRETLGMFTSDEGEYYNAINMNFPVCGQYIVTLQGSNSGKKGSAVFIVESAEGCNC